MANSSNSAILLTTLDVKLERLKSVIVFMIAAMCWVKKKNQKM